MHPQYTAQFVTDHISDLHDRAARWRLAAPLRTDSITAIRPARLRARWRARRPRPATT